VLQTPCCDADGIATVDRSTVARLAKTLTATERGKQSSMFTSVSPSCCSLLKPEMVQDDDAIVREDQRVTTRQFLRSLSANKGSVIHIVPDL
jgi:hypothetical protein